MEGGQLHAPARDPEERSPKKRLVHGLGQKENIFFTRRESNHDL
jgi:hypothetical protein